MITVPRWCRRAAQSTRVRRHPLLPGAVRPSGAARGAIPGADGEVIAARDNGRGDFQLLQARMNVGRPTGALMVAVPVVFVTFADLSRLSGRCARRAADAGWQRNLE
jgi:hypothetical protein